MHEYTRVIRFDRIGLHFDIPDLTYRSDNALEENFTDTIEHYVDRYLAAETVLSVNAHPDQPYGHVVGWKAGFHTLAEFTVHMPDEPLQRL